MRYDLSKWPEIDLANVRAAFPEIPLEAYPELRGYSRAAIHDGLEGQGGIFLASDMAKLLRLRPGMRVLDLGCGFGATAIFLARTYGVNVLAVDMELSDTLLHRATESGVGDLISLVQADCRNLPFAAGYFDAVFSMNAFFYFGTDDLFPPYLLKFIKEEGELVIGCPCYKEELPADAPEELLLEFPACLAVHSPGWWRNHFAKSRQAIVLHSELHPRGVEFWDDRIRFLLESQPLKEMPSWMPNMIYAMIQMRNRDSEGFVSHFMLHAKKKSRTGA